MNHQAHLPKLVMLIIALAQGLILLFLYRAFEAESWPSQSPLWSYPLWTLGILTPLLLLLSVTRSNFSLVVRYVAGFSLLLALVGVYTGSQAEPFRKFPVGNMTSAYAFSILLGSFIALMHMQQRSDRVALTYQVLFTNSWRNFLVGALSACLMSLFWLLLVLWGQLFEVIGIDFFELLFREDWFIFPTLSVVFGWGIVLFRELTRVIDSITKLLHWLLKMLLPLVIFMALAFLSTLPFVGLETLWSTGSGTNLLLWLLAISLFLVNAVYQDGREAQPYPKVIHQLIYMGFCIMPIVSALSLYGLVLRLSQYGWTVERCWAFVTWVVLSAFSVGYLVGILRRRSAWITDLAWVNTAMGLIILIIMVLANSPLLDFRKISLNSQLSRLESGDLELMDYDFWYTKHYLARPGYLAMQKIKATIDDPESELIEMINSPVRKRWVKNVRNPEVLWQEMQYRPTPFDLPDNIKEKIERGFSGFEDNENLLLRIDLNGDSQFEYIALSISEGKHPIAYIYYLNGDTWKQKYVSLKIEQFEGTEWLNHIRNGEIQLVEPKYKNIKIGDILIETVLNN